MAAIDKAGRDEFFMVGGAGSATRWSDIKADNTVLKATVIYPPTLAADGIKLARLIAQGKGMADLVEVEVPKRDHAATRPWSPRRTSTSTCRPRLRVLTPG